MGKVDGLPLFIANGKNGSIRAFNYDKSQNSLILWKSWSVDTQPEGMVIDDEHQVLYVGEEQNGIWRIDLKSPESEPTLIISSTAADNENIRYDIEGLAIYDNGEGQGFLVASSQGNFTYAVFDRLTNEYLGSFKIMAGNQIDGVEETDGLEIYSRSLTDQYPKGILLVQDGFNYEGDSLVAQNFKLVNFSDVLKALED
jgi:3-phytase